VIGGSSLFDGGTGVGETRQTDAAAIERTQAAMKAIHAFSLELMTGL
jgi:hypothetical protein